MKKKTFIIVILFSLSGVPLLAGVTFPPLPDFTKHENYAEWYEKAAGVPEKDNAYDLYVKFMPGLVGSDVDEKDWPEFAGMLTDPAQQQAAMAEDGGQSPMSPSPWFPDRRGSWEASYKKTQAVLKKFSAAAERKYVFAPPSIDGGRDDNANRLAFMLLTHAPKMNECAKGNLESAWRIGKDGNVDPEKFIAAIETSIRAGGQLQYGMFAVEQLAGYAMRRNACRHLRWAFAHGVLSEKHAAGIAKDLRKFDGRPVDASPVLAGECAMILDNLQYVFGPLGGGGVKLNGNRYREVTGSAITGGNRFGLGARVDADPTGTADAVLAAFKAMDQPMGPGYSGEKNGEITRIAGDLVRKNNLTKGLLYGIEGTYSRYYFLAAQCEAERRATQVLMEVFAYKAKSKKWPKTLGALNKKRVGKVLKDPFSNKPFKYLINNDAPVLYSVGPDGEDDGGAHDDMGNTGSDFVYWPIANSEEVVIASRLNRVKDKDLTPLAQIGEKQKGKRITVAAEVISISSRPSKKHGQRHSIMLKQDDAEVKLYYYERVAQEMTPRQKLVNGRRIRVIGKVVKEDEKWRIELRDARDLALEE